MRIETESESGENKDQSSPGLLGFSFYKTKGKYEIRISEKSLNRIKAKCKFKTRSSNPTSEKSKILKLDAIIRGWVNYFKIANAKSNMQKLDEMVRSRLRIMTWRKWKRIRTKVVNLMNLGIERSKAYMWGNTSKKPCRISHSPILLRTLNNKYWRKAGYVGFYNYYSTWQTETGSLLF